MRAIALLSGGLDSKLAIRVVQQQGIEVEAVNFRTHFACCRDQAAQAARELGVRLTVLPIEDDYLDLIKRPRHGYGKGTNPCIDCRAYMFRKAAGYLEQCDARFAISGEIVGQRPMSQKRRDLDLIADESGLGDRLLRPLSARVLPPTLPERAGWVDRRRMYGFTGRGRRGLIRLARAFGFRDLPQPSTGCALTERLFAPKVFDLIECDPDARSWDFELLNVGRHVRFDANTKVVVGRRERENHRLESMFARDDAAAAAMLRPHQFAGPTALVIGRLNPRSLEFAGGLIARYASRDRSDTRQVLVDDRHGRRLISVAEYPPAMAAATL